MLRLFGHSICFSDFLYQVLQEEIFDIFNFPSRFTWKIKKFYISTTTVPVATKLISLVT